MDNDLIASIVLDEAFTSHKSLGPGLLESVYETLMVHQLNNHGSRARPQVSVPFIYNTVRFEK